MKVNCWIVFQWQTSVIHDGQWMPCVVGVFDDESKAAAACTTAEHYIFPMELNREVNGDPEEHPLVYYPLAHWKTLANRNAGQPVLRK